MLGVMIIVIVTLKKTLLFFLKIWTIALFYVTSGPCNAAVFTLYDLIFISLNLFTSIFLRICLSGLSAAAGAEFPLRDR